MIRIYKQKKKHIPNAIIRVMSVKENVSLENYIIIKIIGVNY